MLLFAPVTVEGRGPNILLRLLWFVLVGWWLGLLVSGLAWVLNLTIIGLPLGLMLINRLPVIVTLRPQEQSWRLEGNVLVKGQQQYPFLVRALWFFFIGDWLSGVWLLVAYAALLTVVLIPLAFWMYGRIGAVTTLYRS
ncbi:MAG: YccF domain-containing protein [Chloroflexota bacterium]